MRRKSKCQASQNVSKVHTSVLRETRVLGWFVTLVPLMTLLGADSPRGRKAERWTAGSIIYLFKCHKRHKRHHTLFSRHFSPDAC